jgi:release factor glutamine methyltransferase
MTAVASSQTVSDALHTATATLARASSSPRLDAELLLEHVTGLARSSFHATPERELPAQAGWAFQQLVTRRLKGEPIAYIRGQQEFWSLLFEVTPAVLIPRPETELAVERILAHTAADSTAALADIGTGSGAIALAAASERRQMRVVATDVSAPALEVAVRNAARLQIATVDFRRGSWFAPLDDEGFQIIASNPPYVAENDPDLAAHVRRYEPTTALIAGQSGIEALKLLVEGAPAYLHSGGWLILEHGWKQGPDVCDLLVRRGFAHVRSHADLAGHERVTEGCWL